MFSKHNICLFDMKILSNINSLSVFLIKNKLLFDENEMNWEKKAIFHYVKITTFFKDIYLVVLVCFDAIDPLTDKYFITVLPGN